MHKYLLSILIILLFLISNCGNNNNSEDPIDPEEEEGLTECLTAESADVLEVMTWNVKNFPMSGQATKESLTIIINEQKPDIIAFQEIVDIAEFTALDDTLSDYKSQIYVEGSLNHGYFYKTSEITIDENIQPILEGDSYAFPRSPAMITVSHKNGISATLINIHLKCCDGVGNYNRRKDASNQLKEYIDTNLPDENVILLGDFNDDIYGIPDVENPFLNFIDDTDNYLFADMPLAMSDRSDWSYPSWPSHIDHILISNELFDELSGAVTLSFDNCLDDYFSTVSDHRPVLIKLDNS